MHRYNYYREGETPIIQQGQEYGKYLPERNFFVYWNYENPDEKNINIARIIMNKQGSKIANNLDNNSKEEIEGYRQENPYEITDEIYNKEIAIQAEIEIERQKIEAQYKEEKEARKIIEDKKIAEKKIFENLIKNGNEEYFNYVKVEWEKIKTEQDRHKKYRNFKNLLINFTIRKSNLKKESNYYIISKRTIINGQIQPCTPNDFAISKEDWFYIKERIRSYSWDENAGCHINGTGTGGTFDLDGRNCILLEYKNVIQALEQEFSCLNTWEQIKYKSSNLRASIANKFKKNTTPVIQDTTPVIQDTTPVQDTNPVIQPPPKKGFLSGLFSGGKKTKRGTKRTKGGKKSKKMKGKKKK